jgi:ribokinase
MRIAVVGHVEHIIVGRVDAVPRPGEIAHLESPRVLPGGGGGIAFFQLVRSPAEVHLFSALGKDDAAAQVEERLVASGAHLHLARRPEPHTRDVVMVTPDGERTIVVVGEPLHPRRSDGLPWDLLSTCDAAYFTAQDPEALRAARAARLLLVAARRRPALVASTVRADVVVGSRHDAREVARLADFPVAPGALVLTAGAAGGTIETSTGTSAFPAPARAPSGGGAYGAGDSFAGALTYYLAAGLSLLEACTRAGVHGAAVRATLDPLDGQLPLPALSIPADP